MSARGVLRVARIGLNTVDPEALAAFFVDALGFDRRPSSATTVQLGDVPVDLHRVAPSAPAGPTDVPGWSPLFQHFAIIVSDMTAAMRRLTTSTRWTPITIDGPQRLPARNGGVTAFKFRDPDGHPLELLALPDGSTTASPSVRIDHSAISVAEVARSLAFYADLGLHVATRSLNIGQAQQRLDAIVDAEVDVIGLATDTSATPHIELLGYRGDHDRSGIEVAAVDAISATRLVLTVADRNALAEIGARHADAVVHRSDKSLLLRDPDGHLLELVVEG